MRQLDMRGGLASLLLCALSAMPLAAQQMPDPAQMAGQPLPAPELQTGTVSVRVVRERMGNNVTNHPVTLAGSGQRLDANTDAQGRATFSDLPPGTRMVAQSIVDGETLQSQPFTIPASGGTRIALIAGIGAAAAREQAAREEGARQPARQGVVVFGGESRVILEFQDDNLQVFYLLDIVNNARTPIDVGEPLYIVLPEGATGAGALQGSSTQAVVQNDRIRINGPFAPGITKVQVGYRFPYNGDTAVLTQPWPAAMEQLFVAAEKVGPLQISSPQFQQQQEATAGGAPFLMATGGRINAGDALVLTLSGLPHRSTLLRDVGVAVGVLILIAGFWGAFAARDPRAGRLQQLTARKEQLLSDIVLLDDERRQNTIDERRYASRRQQLVTELERVLSELDHSGEPFASPRGGGGPGAGGEGLAA